MPNKTSEITLEKEEAKTNITFNYTTLNMNLEPSLFGSFFDIDIIKIWKVNYLSNKLN